jgi:hypothetical protein
VYITEIKIATATPAQLITNIFFRDEGGSVLGRYGIAAI